MRIVLKIILSFVVLLIATPISAAAKEVPFLNLILVAGIVGWLIAIWRYNPKTGGENAVEKSAENLSKPTRNDVPPEKPILTEKDDFELDKS